MTLRQMTVRRRLAATTLSAALLVGTAAGCSDEDGDGAVLDEEVENVEEGVGGAADEVEEEVDAVTEEDEE